VYGGELPSSMETNLDEESLEHIALDAKTKNEILSLISLKKQAIEIED